MPKFSRIAPRFTLLAVTLLSIAASPHMQAAVPIADARSTSTTVTTIRGTVTVPAGAFASSTFDQGFALQDDSGGIYVTMTDNAGLTRGRHVRVTGTTGDDGNGLTVFRVTSVADVRPAISAADPAPRVVGTGEVGEATEGTLVQVQGAITRDPTNDMPYGYSVFVDDGTGETQVFIPASTGVNPFRLRFAKPGRTVRVTGFSGQYQSQYEVLPRSLSDIVAVP